MMPIIHELEDDFKKNEKIKIVTLDTDKTKTIAKNYSILGVPAFVVFNNGKIIEQVS